MVNSEYMSYLGRTNKSDTSPTVVYIILSTCWQEMKRNTKNNVEVQKLLTEMANFTIHILRNI